MEKIEEHQNKTNKKLTAIWKFLNNHNEIMVYNKSQNYALMGYLLLLAIKVIIFDCIYLKDQDYHLIKTLYIKHIIVLFMIALLSASIKFDYIQFKSSVYFQNLRDIGIGTAGFALVMIWTELFIIIQQSYTKLDMVFGFEIAIFLQIVTSKLQKNWVRILFSIFSIVYVSFRVCFEDYRSFIETLILVILFLGFYCSQKQNFDLFLQPLDTEMESITINDKIQSDNNKIANSNNQEYVMQSPNSSGQKTFTKQQKNRKRSSWKASISQVDINRMMFLNGLIDIYAQGLVLVNRNFETIFSNKWIEEKFTKQVLEEINFYENEQIVTVKDKLIEMELKNYESIENLYLPCLFSKILGTVSLRLFRGFLNQNLVYICHISLQKNQPLSNTPKIYQQLQSINMQNLLAADSRNDIPEIYRFLFQKDLLGIRKNKTYFINKYLIKINEIKKTISKLFQQLNASLEFLEVEPDNQQLQGNLQLLIYFTYCVYIISKQKLNKMIITIRKNKLIYSFCKTDPLYTTFLKNLIEKICQKVNISEESVELIFAKPEDSIYEMQVAYQKYLPQLITLKEGMFDQSVQITTVEDPFKSVKQQEQIYIFQQNSDYIQQKLRNKGFLKLNKIFQEDLENLETNKLLIADINDIKTFLKEQKIVNKCLIIIEGYFSCQQKDFIPLNNDLHFLTPAYLLEEEFRQLLFSRR